MELHTSKSMNEGAGSPRQLSTSALVLDNHRMVDTANERLNLILCTLTEVLTGTAAEESAEATEYCSDLPTAIVPLLGDMLYYQSVNNDLIERILEIVENKL